MASANAPSDSALLSKSANGATFLICLQIGSRTLTFIVNQILLRFLSPELLGIATQFELYCISVLYFARESLRVALQRQGNEATGAEKGQSADAINDEKTNTGGKVVERYALRQRAQETVNLSYIAVGLGPPLSSIFATIYLKNAGPALLATPYITGSLTIYAIAIVFELSAEPYFAVAQQQMLYSTRASAETSATLTRCIVTCATAIWASSTDLAIGALPFAVGQLGYAVVMAFVYHSKARSVAKNGGFSLLPKTLKSSDPSQYVLSRFPRRLLTLALNIYAQSGLKHLLTQGDSILIAQFTSFTSQGVYALASNYGSLLARMLFQPIEESSRGVFGRLLSSSNPASLPNTPPSQPSHHPSSQSAPPPNNSPSNLHSHANILSARSYLLTILHLYSLLSLLLTTIAPTLSPLLLASIAGPHWTHTPAGSVLSLYCYYIPLLAFNGILEAFVASVATPAQLRAQGLWMMAFSACFAGTGWLVLGVWEMGARGLVLANGVNMAMRILWSWGFVEGWFGRRDSALGVGEVLPTGVSLMGGVVTAGVLKFLSKDFSGGLEDLVKTVMVGGIYGITLLFLERRFLLECYRMLRPSASSSQTQSTGSRKFS